MIYVSSGVPGDSQDSVLTGSFEESVDTTLETGVVCLGSASGPTGSAEWYDSSMDTDYGHGERFQHEETYGMTKVASRHKR